MPSTRRATKSVFWLWHSRVGYVLLVGLPLLVGTLTVIIDSRSVPSWAICAAVVMLFLTLRAGRLGVVVTREELVVRGWLWTRHLPLDEVISGYVGDYEGPIQPPPLSGNLASAAITRTDQRSVVVVGLSGRWQSVKQQVELLNASIRQAKAEPRHSATWLHGEVGPKEVPPVSRTGRTSTAGLNARHRATVRLLLRWPIRLHDLVEATVVSGSQSWVALAGVLGIAAAGGGIALLVELFAGVHIEDAFFAGVFFGLVASYVIFTWMIIGLAVRWAFERTARKHPTTSRGAQARIMLDAANDTTGQLPKRGRYW